MADDDTRRTAGVPAGWRELGVYPRPGTPDELARFIESDRSTWQEVLDKLNIKPE